MYIHTLYFLKLVILYLYYVATLQNILVVFVYIYSVFLEVGYSVMAITYIV